MALPNNQTITSGNIYQVGTGAVAGTVQGLANLALGTTGLVTIASPVATNTDVTFTQTGGVQTVSYINGAGNTVSQPVTFTGQGPGEFTFTSGSSTFLFTNTALNGGATIDVGSLPGGALLGTQLGIGANPTVYALTTNGLAQVGTGTYTACLVRGTHVATPDGERQVEHLRIGDLVMTVTGESKPVLWIGTRRYEGAFIAGNRTALPVTVLAGALGDGLPLRDLSLSPCHALLINDVLVPAGRLVDGVAVIQASTVDSVDYFHIELDDHDVVLAEGVGAETFVDDDSRNLFQNVHEYHALYPNRPEIDPVYAAPRVEDGEVVQAIRDRIAARATAVKRAA
ncbi:MULTISPECIES: Hint domain-containing protein [Methylorubrum]|uniref:Hint domain-containing protein n=1 Tax=Methylorubrum TaxID=2282523 RepID=UPI00209F4EE0|nr:MULTISPECIES: Hint domain-containing protein [Methylorubrum]MCP1551032.1 hypothetical protein [Methylorubrum zatmanii]MCP1552354.1 hypothetical protein [Methylorubrum extorquens]MCP1581336.1 hypothetical protein [Methylorubrum extorquens]